jgi:hypothetical protein
MIGQNQRWNLSQKWAQYQHIADLNQDWAVTQHNLLSLAYLPRQPHPLRRRWGRLPAEEDLATNHREKVSGPNRLPPALSF